MLIRTSDMRLDVGGCFRFDIYRVTVVSTARALLSPLNSDVSVEISEDFRLQRLLQTAVKQLQRRDPGDAVTDFFCRKHP